MIYVQEGAVTLPEEVRINIMLFLGMEDRLNHNIVISHLIQGTISKVLYDFAL